MCNGKIYKYRSLASNDPKAHDLLDLFYKKLRKSDVLLTNGKWNSKKDGLKVSKRPSQYIYSGQTDFYKLVSKTLKKPWKDLYKQGLRMVTIPHFFAPKSYYIL